MPHAITVELSDTLYHHLQRASEIAQQPMQALVSQSLAHSILPLMTDIPEEYQGDLFPLLNMSEAELYAETRRLFPQSQWAVYEALLAKQKEKPLSREERRELEQLRRQADLVMLRKGYAALLLKRRGYQPPTVDELPSPR